MLPDLDSIALFVKAAELRSLTKAAEASSMGLAAASRRISLLEHRLKSTLFDRSHKGVNLTPAGEILLVHARQLLVQLNQMQADLEDHGLGTRRLIRVHANTSAMAQYLPADLARFSSEHPEVALQVKERWSAQIAEALLLGEADLGIINAGSVHERLECKPYRTDHLAVVMPRNHQLSQQTEIWFEDVLDYSLVGLEQGASLTALLAAKAGLVEKPMKVRVEMQGFEAVCRMIEAGMGLGILPAEAVAAYSLGMGLVVHPMRDEWASRQMYVCTARGREPSVLLQLLVDELSSVRNDAAYFL